MPGDVGDSGSWNFYSYGYSDPINTNDPEGLLPRVNLQASPNPTCWDRAGLALFGAKGAAAVSGAFNEFFKPQNPGTLALTVFFEMEAADVGLNRVIWRSIAHVWRNRWHLSNADKEVFFGPYYPGTKTRWPKTPSRWSFQEMLYYGGGNPPNKRIWTGINEVNPVRWNRLIGYLNSPADSPVCSGIIGAFSEASDVFNDSTADPNSFGMGPALFYSSSPSIDSRVGPGHDSKLWSIGIGGIWTGSLLSSPDPTYFIFWTGQRR